MYIVILLFFFVIACGGRTNTDCCIDCGVCGVVLESRRESELHYIQYW